MTSTETGIKGQPATVTLSTGDQLEIVIQNPDMVRWDLTRPKHGWPSMEDAPLLWATFTAWACAKRTGLTASKWEEWSESLCLAVDMPNEDQPDVPPTP